MTTHELQNLYYQNPAIALKHIADQAVAKTFGISPESINNESSALVREARRVCFFLLKRPWDETKKDRLSDRKITEIYGHEASYHSNVYRYGNAILSETEKETALKTKIVQAKATYLSLYAQLTQTTN